MNKRSLCILLYLFPANKKKGRKKGRKKRKKEKKTRIWSLLNFTAGKECLLITWLCFDNLSLLIPSSADQLLDSSIETFFVSTPGAAFKSGAIGLIHILTSTISGCHLETPTATGVCASRPYAGWETRMHSTQWQRRSQAWGGMVQDALRSRCCWGDKSDHTDSWAGSGLCR